MNHSSPRLPVLLSVLVTLIGEHQPYVSFRASQTGPARILARASASVFPDY
jgi:hypothetical protein